MKIPYERIVATLVGPVATLIGLGATAIVHTNISKNAALEVSTFIVSAAVTYIAQHKWLDNLAKWWVVEGSKVISPPSTPSSPTVMPIMPATGTTGVTYMTAEPESTETPPEEEMPSEEDMEAEASAAADLDDAGPFDEGLAEHEIKHAGAPGATPDGPPNTPPEGPAEITTEIKES